MESFLYWCNFGYEITNYKIYHKQSSYCVPHRRSAWNQFHVLSDKCGCILSIKQYQNKQQKGYSYVASYGGDNITVQKMRYAPCISTACTQISRQRVKGAYRQKAFKSDNLFSEKYNNEYGGRNCRRKNYSFTFFHLCEVLLLCLVRIFIGYSIFAFNCLSRSFCGFRYSFFNRLVLVYCYDKAV